MPLVLAVEPRKCERGVDGFAAAVVVGGSVWRARRNVGAGCGTGFVGAVGAVAVVVVDAGEGEGDGGVGDAGESAGAFVKFGDYGNKQRLGELFCEGLKLGVWWALHSGLTPRGLPSEAAYAIAAYWRHKIASTPFMIMKCTCGVDVYVDEW